MKNMEDGIKRNKREIRKAVLNSRDNLSKQEREKASLLLTERILGHQWFYRAEQILCFVSYGSEISTRGILEEALKAGKKVYVPKVLSGKKHPEMCFYRITGLTELETGYRGIPEPAGDSEEYVYSQEEAERTLLLMPGVAFDRYRNRIGYGKGFYDRFLEDKPRLQQRAIAVGYRCQMTDTLPAEKTDIRPYQVICV